ncbi:hypothetical protein [Bradyrhizobium sp. SRL28]|jgi:hypothetical protein|uniref:hypothetical protein n=1 Tax=Bradyrhizobium sp. SRL28 TaxID=2836178 RepID=UPI0027E0DE18|nr:hypothetical protein [Bradyrhizobium sp. SRL28]
MREQLKWYDDKARTIRLGSTRLPNCGSEPRERATATSTSKAITVAIDQYAEKALGNRDYFLNKPYGVG